MSRHILNEPFRPIITNISENTIACLDDLAQRLGWPRSEVIRTIITGALASDIAIELIAKGPAQPSP